MQTVPAILLPNIFAYWDRKKECVASGLTEEMLIWDVALIQLDNKSKNKKDESPLLQHYLDYSQSKKPEVGITHILLVTQYRMPKHPKDVKRMLML